MKKVIGLIVAAILAIGVFAGTVFCVYTFGDYGKDKKESDKDNDKNSKKKDKKKDKKEEVIDNIGFIYTSSNYAWGNYFSGYYVDVDGQKYSFNYDDYSGRITDEMLVDTKNMKKDGKISSDKFSKLVKKANRIGDDLDLEGYSYACDMGSWSVRMVVYDDDGDYEVTLIGEYGDWIFVPTDDNARYISEYFGLDFSAVENMTPVGHMGKDGVYKRY